MRCFCAMLLCDASRIYLLSYVLALCMTSASGVWSCDYSRFNNLPSLAYDDDCDDGIIPLNRAVSGYSVTGVPVQMRCFVGKLYSWNCQRDVEYLELAVGNGVNLTCRMYSGSNGYIVFESGTCEGHIHFLNAVYRSGTRDPTAPPTNPPTTSRPTPSPTTSRPTPSPTPLPTRPPTRDPSSSAPTPLPTQTPTVNLTSEPTPSPTWIPTSSPSENPTRHPTPTESQAPTTIPTRFPTYTPTQIPSDIPSVSPTMKPTQLPTPSNFSSTLPTMSDTTRQPSSSPTPYSLSPTLSPTGSPSETQLIPSFQGSENEDGMGISVYIGAGVGFVVLCAAIFFITKKALRKPKEGRKDQAPAPAFYASDGTQAIDNDRYEIAMTLNPAYDIEHKNEQPNSAQRFLVPYETPPSSQSGTAVYHEALSTNTAPLYDVPSATPSTLHNLDHLGYVAHSDLRSNSDLSHA